MPMNAAMPYNIRQEGGEAAGLGGLEDLIVEVEEGGPKDDIDDKGNILRVEYPDGSIAVAIDGKPVEEAEGDKIGRAHV